MNADSNFRIQIEQDEDGIFIASVAELPGCSSQGMTEKEALSNIEDAIQGYLASLRKHNEPIPSQKFQYRICQGFF
jgi:antitoxin HicB